MGTNSIKPSSFSVRDSREDGFGAWQNLLLHQIDGRDRETGTRCTCGTRCGAPLRRVGAWSRLGRATDVESFQREYLGSNSGGPMGRRVDVLGRQTGLDWQEL